ncbi:MAG: GH25 family lysozyme, partial [Acutalibacteraceae bacterium]
MKLSKKIGALMCSLALLLSMVAACGLSVSAYTGGGMTGDSNVAILGADLSYWNVGADDLNYSYVDFQKMYNDGCKFVILRIGYEASATRVDTLDKAFLKYYEMARKVEGLKLGVYFYSLAYSRAAAVQDAQWVIQQIENNNMYFEYPIYYDVEDPGNGTSSRPGHDTLSSSQMTELCLGWAETMEAAGYFPGVYGGVAQTADKLLTGAYADRYDMWVANYGSTDGGYTWNSRDFRSKAGMWQYCSRGHNYDGLTLDFMDANVSYKDYASIIESQGLNNCASGHTITFESNGGSAVASQ